MSSRRSFLTRIGAGVSTALASAAVIAEPSKQGKSDDSPVRVAQLEAEQELRRLHRSFEQALDAGRTDEVVALFTENAEVIFNGGVFDNRRQGISRLYQSSKTGTRMEPAPGFVVAADEQQDSVAVAEDLASATAVFPFSIGVSRLLVTETSHASMARLQGEGTETWWEGGMYKVTYRRDIAAGPWKISRLEYETLSRADWRSGRSWAGPIAPALFVATYPQDPQGPDSLV